MPRYGITPSTDGFCECGCGRSIDNLIAEGIRHVPLTKGAVALIDADDWGRVRTHKWQCHGRRYAVRTVKRNGKIRMIFLHNFILGRSEFSNRADHINRDTLDNRKSNLRVVSNAHNTQNQGARGIGASGLRNVYWIAGRRKFKVVLHPETGPVYGGYYNTIEAAAEAARLLRIKHFPGAFD